MTLSRVKVLFFFARKRKKMRRQAEKVKFMHETQAPILLPAKQTIFPEKSELWRSTLDANKCPVELFYQCNHVWSLPHPFLCGSHATMAFGMKRAYHSYMCLVSSVDAPARSHGLVVSKRAFLLLLVLSKVEREMLLIVMYVLSCWACGPLKGISREIESLAFVTCYQSREYPQSWISSTFIRACLLKFRGMCYTINYG